MKERLKIAAGSLGLAVMAATILFNAGAPRISH
jgi:hypothetical protein